MTYTQLPFYLHGLSDTVDIKQLIGHVRDISEKFESRGLPNYPSGKNSFVFNFYLLSKGFNGSLNFIQFSFWASEDLTGVLPRAYWSCYTSPSLLRADQSLLGQKC